MKLSNIVMIGRDNRISVAKRLLENDGCCVCHITTKEELASTPIGSIIILPIPYRDASGKIKGSEIYLHDIAPYLARNHFVILGKADGEIESLSKQIGFEICDLNQDLRFKKLNAIPTAEAAVGIAMQNTLYTLNGHCALICGYGCIGKCIAKILPGFGCKVTVAARKHSDRIDAEYSGCRTVELEALGNEICNADIVFNTCPAQVLTADVLKNAKKACVIIDLASRPGGCDFEYAKQAGLNAGLYLSLPDVYSPQTSGENLYKLIAAVVKERE